MLTRSQVARRLNKSLATVRRLEGWKLHAHRDANGVHRFDPAEVRSLSLEGNRCGAPLVRTLECSSLGSGYVRERSRWPSSEFSSREASGERRPSPSHDAAEIDVAERMRSAEERHAARVAEDSIRRRERRACETLAGELLGELAGLSSNQLCRLGSDTITEVIELLEEVGIISD